MSVDGVVFDVDVDVDVIAGAAAEGWPACVRMTWSHVIKNQSAAVNCEACFSLVSRAFRFANYNWNRNQKQT